MQIFFQSEFSNLYLFKFKHATALRRLFDPAAFYILHTFTTN